MGTILINNDDINNIVRIILGTSVFPLAAPRENVVFLSLIL